MSKSIFQINSKNWFGTFQFDLKLIASRTLIILSLMPFHTSGYLHLAISYKIFEFVHSVSLSWYLKFVVGMTIVASEHHTPCLALTKNGHLQRPSPYQCNHHYYPNHLLQFVHRDRSKSNN